MLLTNPGSQGLELPFLGPSLRPLLDDDTVGSVHGAGPALGSHAIAAGLAPTALFASKSRLLAEPSIHLQGDNRCLNGDGICRLRRWHPWLRSMAVAELFKPALGNIGIVLCFGR
jgi:hypothetical protein